MTIIGTIIAGLVVGILARVVLPGKQAYGWIVTILLGIGGALIGYWLASMMGVAETGGIDWIRWILSVAVAAVLSVIFSAITKRRKEVL
ncbi:GlsB/YeaQ/YmgE family stress response membrane protein [Microlunatus sp. Gsoil 973]|jgi:uncharacterized membrane protein YeaQ/YmgE (transglycosylase-associated protein family)|uniref:GlsB/YeaQ/YmgE family stress response membrane protein n=1 Tax=Microlunatus sp. Gsoil 973 TaxID=2672569 RepID=UPI0012B4F39B|nr:GlsB/YeaQ/YmgE family stress response membrane protein [Microlunatus sp. Gsoil 973]QGN35148.1 GlsB/YeaQ/YmgE family stress response membrane protein [Microlunatus sp. Gsoil 973]